MRLKRGLLRLWLIAAVLWVVSMAVLLRPDQPLYWLWWLHSEKAESCGQANWLNGCGHLDRVALESQLKIVEDTIRDFKSSTGQSRFDPIIAELDNALTGKPVPKAVEQWNVLQTKKERLENLVSIARAVKARWSDLRNFAVLGLAPPLGVLLLGFSLSWAIRGFRA